MKRASIAISILVVSSLVPATSFAIPTLQLDIIGGVYDEDTKTIIGPSGEEITLVALFTPNPQEAALLGDTFYVSAALLPAVEAASALGSFVFDGETVNATGDMVFGVPPVESLQGHDAHDLPQHSIFETYFSEHDFMFDASQQVTPYDTELAAGSFTDDEGMGAFYQLFTVNTSLLAEGVNLHFDLYNTVDVDGPLGPQLLKLNNNGIDERDVNQFAPPSHDAETHRNGVPEPGTLALVALGGLALATRRRRN